MNIRLISACALSLCGTALLAQAADEHKPAPVSVSSANFETSSRDELFLAVEGKQKVNPSSRPLDPLARPQRFVFIPGEIYESDISYDEICRRLSATLARKGYHNATDDQGRVVDPKNVDLILRIHAGERTWRNPTVRLESLTWKDGLVARPRGRSLTTLGGDVYWENRAGGNDDALGAAARNENSPGFGFGSTPASPGGQAPLNTYSATASANASAAEYEATREFYLIVVDAFRYSELMTKGDRAKRLWTTFLAAPRQHGQVFSDVLNTMLRVGTPYFGETTSGLQMFNDARAVVTPGPIQVIESDVKLPGKN